MVNALVLLLTFSDPQPSKIFFVGPGALLRGGARTSGGRRVCG